MRLKEKISLSLKELKSTRNIVILGLLIAIYVVLSYFNVYFLPTLRMTFTFVPLSLAGAMFGPVCAALVGAVGDIFGYITSQFGAGAFNPGFTINAFVNGFVFGLFFYKSDFSFKKIVAAKLILAVVVELCLTPIWLSMMYGKAFIVLMIERIFKTLVFFVIEVIVINFVVKKIYKLTVKK